MSWKGMHRAKRAGLEGQEDWDMQEVTGRKGLGYIYWYRQRREFTPSSG